MVLGLNHTCQGYESVHNVGYDSVRIPIVWCMSWSFTQLVGVLLAIYHFKWEAANLTYKTISISN